MNLIFLGTDEFPAPSLKALKEAGYTPSLVVTRPDAPKGRGRKIYPQKIRLLAEELGLPCEQPADVCDPAFTEGLRARSPDLILVVSFGRILSPGFLAIPSRCCLNAHASLLPRWRGAAPVHHAIWAGDDRTGVTIQRIAPELDSGDILLTRETAIGPHESAGSLFGRLSDLAAEALIEALHLFEDGKEAWTPQDPSLVTRAPKLQKEQGFVDWSLSAGEIDRLVRAFTPRPGSRTRLGPRRIILLEGRPEEDHFGLGMPGGVLTAGEEGIRVCTGEGIYRITRLKPENGRNMSAGEFVRGHQMPPDARLG